MIDKSDIQKQLYYYLSSFITESRKKKFEEIIAKRTRYITVVLEDIFQSHNASAVLRTAECLGIQDVHIIENKNTYNINPKVTLGSAKWINIIRYNDLANDTENCIFKLKKTGYRIIATCPHREGYTLHKFPLDSPAAFVFGNELEGLSDIVINAADAFVKLPMYGFTESYNISVAVAITLSEIIDKLHTSSIRWQLNEDEKYKILLQWAKNTIKHSKILEKEFLKNYKNENNNQI